MNRELVIVSVLLILIALVACSPAEKVAPVVEKPSVEEPLVISETTQNSPPVVEEPEVAEQPVIDKVTIKITSSGFEPKTLTFKTGTTVTFVNEDSNKHWPASAMHPTHTIYPGSDIKKCGSGQTIFDACGGLGKDESFSFTFNEKGSWKYHDHLRSSSTGTIIVE